MDGKDLLAKLENMEKTFEELGEDYDLETHKWKEGKMASKMQFDRYTEPCKRLFRQVEVEFARYYDDYKTRTHYYEKQNVKDYKSCVTAVMIELRRMMKTPKWRLMEYFDQYGHEPKYFKSKNPYVIM